MYSVPNIYGVTIKESDAPKTRGVSPKRVGAVLSDITLISKLCVLRLLCTVIYNLLSFWAFDGLFYIYSCVLLSFLNMYLIIC